MPLSATQPSYPTISTTDCAACDACTILGPKNPASSRRRNQQQQNKSVAQYTRHASILPVRHNGSMCTYTSAPSSPPSSPASGLDMKFSSRTMISTIEISGGNDEDDYFFGRGRHSANDADSDLDIMMGMGGEIAGGIATPPPTDMVLPLIVVEDYSERSHEPSSSARSSISSTCSNDSSAPLASNKSSSQGATSTPRLSNGRARMEDSVYSPMTTPFLKLM